MPHKGKGVHCQYNRDDLEKAVFAVYGGLSVRNAAAQFNVPRSTIHDRVSGRISVNARPGKQTTFPAHVEQLLADKMKQAAEMGFGTDRKQLKVKAARLAVKMNIKTPFKNGIPGDDWVNSFQERNGLSLRSQVALSTVRSRMLNQPVVSKYFEDLEKTVQTLNPSDHPDRIWNMDETSVSLTHKPTRVLAKKGSRNVPGRVGNSRESVTVLACVNAAGSDVPPMVIVKGKTKKSLNGLNVSAGPHETQWTYQSKGWMEESLGTDWFKHVFVPHIGPHRPQLLLLDSRSSHETLDIIECALKENITMFALPPHTTQWLNPLDKTVFGPFSNEYNRQCTEFMAKSPNNMVCKWEWPGLFKLAYERTFTKHNITTGFVKCGVYPVAMSAIPACAFMPSNVFDLKLQQGTESLTVTTEASVTLPEDVEVNAVPPPEAVHESGSSVENVTGDQAMILGTADEDGNMVLEAVTAAEVLQAIMESGIADSTDVSVDTVSKPATSEHVDYAAISMTTVDRDGSILSTQVEDLFQLPMPERKTASKRKLTSHRILTSGEIVKQKQEAKVNKEQEVKLKEERKLARQQNAMKKKVKKMKTN